MQPVSSAGKYAVGFKRGRTCNRFQLRENMQTVPSTGKYAVGSKRRRTCNQFQARQKMPFPSAGERWQATLWFVLALLLIGCNLWESVYSDRLIDLQCAPPRHLHQLLWLNCISLYGVNETSSQTESKQTLVESLFKIVLSEIKTRAPGACHLTYCLWFCCCSEFAKIAQSFCG